MNKYLLVEAWPPLKEQHDIFESKGTSVIPRPSFDSSLKSKTFLLYERNIA